jgi:hypothetical protein
MRTGNKYYSRSKKQAILLFAWIVMSLTCLSGRADCMIFDNPVNVMRHCFAAVHSGNLSSLQGTKSERGSGYFGMQSSKDSLEKNSSQPFSSQNYNKTRSRGIAVQETEFKYPVFPALLILYPPDPVRIFFPGWLQPPASTKHYTDKIRPPPLPLSV